MHSPHVQKSTYLQIVIIIIILLQRYPFSNTLKKPNYIKLTAVGVENENADLTGSRSLRRNRSLIFIAHEVLFQMAFK